MSAEVEEVRTADMVTVTETSFEWTSREHHLMDAVHIQQPLLEWARAHGLDPDRMPYHGRIVRDVERCQVRCPYFRLDEDGKRIPIAPGSTTLVVEDHVAQGETPPMPWPDVVLKLMAVG